MDLSERGFFMEVKVQIGQISEFKADVVILNLFEGVIHPSGETGSVDNILSGIIQDELQKGKTFKGKLGETLVLSTYGKIPARYVVVVGLGKQAELKGLQIRRASAAAIRACKKLKAQTVVTLLYGAGTEGLSIETAARLLAEGAILGVYEFTCRKTNIEKDSELPDNTVETLTIVEQDSTKQEAIEKGIKIGSVIADATNMARDLVFDSPNNVTPTLMAEIAEHVIGNNITCKIMEKEDIEKLGMMAFLSVAKGSANSPKLIHLSYRPSSGAVNKKVAIVGKGITFDSGGLSLKPANAMELMKDDMSGAAAVISVMQAIAKLGDLDIQVDAIAPCCENMPSGNANRPGDIVNAMNGKTIEILNTDAEGRLILADALVYAQQEVKPDELIDLATLTGACVIALGKEASGIMGNDEELISAIRKAGEISGERYWPLPLFEEYRDMLKSEVADIVNVGSKGQAGSSLGGIFLKEFIAEPMKWAHLDIAGPAYTDRDIPEVPKGATGVGVRTLLYYLYGFSEA